MDRLRWQPTQSERESSLDSCLNEDKPWEVRMVKGGAHHVEETAQMNYWIGLSTRTALGNVDRYEEVEQSRRSIFLGQSLISRGRTV